MEDFLISLKEINKFSEEYSNDLASSFFTFSVSLGATIGPIIGAYYSEKKGFDYSCFVGFSALGVATENYAGPLCPPDFSKWLGEKPVWPSRFGEPGNTYCPN